MDISDLFLYEMDDIFYMQIMPISQLIKIKQNNDNKLKEEKKEHRKIYRKRAEVRYYRVAK